MRKDTDRLHLAGCRLCLMFALSVVSAAGASDWSYHGAHGPEHWGEMSADFGLCRHGQNQSPVDLRGAIDAALPMLAFDYRQGGRQLVHNGHTLQVDFPAGNVVQLGSERFELAQWHAHAPSEHRIDGRSFPLEIHLVHRDAGGRLAVVAVLFEEGASNPALAAAWIDSAPSIGQTRALDDDTDPNDLLPAHRAHYQLNGSLTTPPCSEGVRWIVFKSTMTASGEQIAYLRRSLHGPNNRPVQPLNARLLTD